jgi:altronate dehydratase small subunit
VRQMGLSILIDGADNVATVLQKTHPGDEIIVQDRNLKKVGNVISRGEIPFAHKISLVDIGKGCSIYKFGVVIGRATADISTGDHVHVHNVISIEGAEKVVKGGAGE